MFMPRLRSIAGVRKPATCKENNTANKLEWNIKTNEVLKQIINKNGVNQRNTLCDQNANAMPLNFNNKDL